MSDKLFLTAKDVEKYAGVSGLDAAEWTRLVGMAVGFLRTGMAMWAAPVAKATGVGAATIVATAAGPKIAAGAAAIATFAVSFGAAIAAFPLVMLSLGLPAAQAKAKTKKRALYQGFAYGAVIGLFGHGKRVLTDFVDRTSGRTTGPSYMDGIHKNFYNAGLMLGYASAISMTAAECHAFRQLLTGLLIKNAKEGNYKLYMDAWSDFEWIAQYARVFHAEMRD